MLLFRSHSWLCLQILDQARMVSKENRSSLFGLSVSNEVKSFITLKPDDSETDKNIYLKLLLM